jgi:hypothetical protein
MKRDPGNMLFWRMNRQRLDAEAMRDSLLAISGELTCNSGGPALVLENPANCGSLVQKGVNPPNYAHRVPRPSQEFERTIYLPVMRTSLTNADKLRGVFDFVDPAMIAGQRNQTTVPTQSLFLLSNELFRKRAKALAAGLIATVPDTGARLDQLWLRVFNRPITAAERRDSIMLLEQVPPLLPAVARPDTESTQWTELCHSVLASNEFIYRL